MLGYLVLGAASFQAQVAPPLTLEEALAIAEQSAFAIRLAESDIAEARAADRVAEAQLGPSASLGASSQWSQAKTSGGFGQNGSQFSNSISVTVRQILDLSKVIRLRVDAAELNVQVAQHGRAATLNDLRGQVKEKFFAALQAEELVGIQERALQSASGRLKDAQIRFEAKAIPKFDVIRLESELKRIEQDLVQAKGNFRVAKQDLNNLLAREIGTDFDPVALPEEVTPGEVATYVRGSLANRPELKRAETAVKALDKVREAEQRAALPTVSLEAGHFRSIDPGFGQPDWQTTASASVSVPIVTSGAIKANTRRAQEQVDRAKILLQQLQLAVAFEVRIALTQFETAQASYETARQNLALAEEAYRLAQLRYQEAVGILLEVTIAQADLTSAQSAVVIAGYQRKAAYAALQKAVGVDDLSSLPIEATPIVPAKEEGGKQL